MRSFLVWAWILSPGCWALTGPSEVSGPLGGSVSVQCQYSDEYQNHIKYWCKGTSWLYCSIVIQTDTAEVAGDRVSIQDNHAQHTFTVTVKSLAPGDEDTYWCGINKRGFDKMLPVNVVISALEDMLRQKENSHPNKTNPGHPLPFTVPHSAATGQMGIYVNKQPPSSSAHPESEYADMQLGRQVSRGRGAASPGPEGSSAAVQQDVYVDMSPITLHPHPPYSQARCGRKAAG
ncbi:CMRF35-like molecule 7 [Carettochelys insculpta]|uniref:CMRF35-like molecule 7 n=1 Tax=Carettochelys insculpta TaxID=44489 RepID=UPI003EBDE665